MQRLKVYIAGPISKGDMLHNLQQADEAFQLLIANGFAPLCPHWSVFHASARRENDKVIAEANATSGNISHQQWLEVDLRWVESADIVLRLPGDSAGADQEVKHAQSKNIPVCFSMEELIAVGDATSRG